VTDKVQPTLGDMIVPIELNSPIEVCSRLCYLSRQKIVDEAYQRCQPR
jgi:hypothetical protein